MNKIASVVSEVLQVDEECMTSDVHLSDLPNYDSFQMLRIVMVIKNRYGVELSLSQVSNVVTIGDLAEMLNDD